MAENYLQHAEHYNRIIMAAMAQQNIPYQREENFDSDGVTMRKPVSFQPKLPAAG